MVIGAGIQVKRTWSGWLASALSFALVASGVSGLSAEAQTHRRAAHTKAARTTDGAEATVDAGATPKGSTAFRNVFWQPNEMVQGSVTFFTVEMEKPATQVSGKFLGKQLAFFKSDKPTVWYSLAGVDLETPPGSYDLAISATVRGRGVVRTYKKVEVGAGDFKVGTVEVPENFVNPDDAGKRQIAADAAAKTRAYAHAGLQPLWSGNFVKPVDAPSTPSFGMTRVYNEELTSQHRGTDYPAREGSAVMASNAGTVVLAQEMFYEGNCVIVDHGQKFFTIYMHLAKMEVKPGDRVAKGQRLGASGATGRVTGPHLHMGVRWNGAYIDPTKLLALTLPETGAAGAPAGAGEKRGKALVRRPSRR